MANAYKNAKLAMTTSLADVYTCPSATEAIILGIQIANVDGSVAADATVAWTDSSDSDTATYLIKSATVEAGQAIPALTDKIVLEAGDKIQAQASAASDLVCTVAVLEIS